MSANLHIRDVPDEVHAILKQRAAEGGKSLRQYTIEVLAEHCALPTLGEWLDELATRPGLSGAEDLGAGAIAASRAEDDEAIAAATPRA